jgi:hypothetical protein
MRSTVSKLAALIFTIAAPAAYGQSAPTPPTPNIQQNAPTIGEDPHPAISAFAQGDAVISAGLALGGINGSAGSMSIPPVFGGFDYAITPDISVGGAVAYYRASASYGYGYDWHYSYTTIAARGDYHFGRFVKVDKLDLYGGLLLGYGIVSVSAEGSSALGGISGASSSANLVVWGADLGARYFFTRSLAAQVELGVGLGNLSLGLAYRL